jgi:acyl carrier protein
VQVAEDTEKEIIAILADISGADEADIKPDTDLAKDLDIDSIKAIEITVAIEKKFKVSVRDEDVPKIMTLRQAVDLVDRLLAQKNAANVKN